MYLYLPAAFVYTFNIEAKYRFAIKVKLLYYTGISYVFFKNLQIEKLLNFRLYYGQTEV